MKRSIEPIEGFDKRMIALMNDKDWSISELSRRTKIMCKTLRNYMYNRAIPSACNLKKLARAFEVTTDFLLDVWGDADDSN